MKTVTIVDYGMGNLFSVSKALESQGVNFVITDDPIKLEMASHLILPGVGAFPDAMVEIRRRGLVDVICAHAAKQRPFLGICLGMQLLFKDTEEYGKHEGLGLIPGTVRAIPTIGPGNSMRKVPHIGWSPIVASPSSVEWSKTILADIATGSYFYFVHSFAAYPEDGTDCLADTDYDGLRISSAVMHNSIYGCQFHPEKSGPIGLSILKNFISL